MENNTDTGFIQTCNAQPVAQAAHTPYPRQEASKVTTHQFDLLRDAFADPNDKEYRLNPQQVVDKLKDSKDKGLDTNSNNLKLYQFEFGDWGTW